MSDLDREIKVVIGMVEAEIADARREYEHARQQYLYAFFLEEAIKWHDANAKPDFDSGSALSTLKAADSALKKLLKRKHDLDHLLEHAQKNLPLQSRLEDVLAQTPHS
jgi:uncharacterized protein YdcH (DUF465 family)